MNKKKAALCACSDLLSEGRRADIERLREVLEAEDLVVELSPCLTGSCGYARGKEKAAILNGFFSDPGMDYIFDISGGDLANTVLPFLDYDAIHASDALFFGYSDLTTVLNAIIARAGRKTVNWQVRNLLCDHAQEQLVYFRDHILKDDIRTDQLKVSFLRGDQMKGRVVGGNTRCFLKLSGTPYWPDFGGSILLLESYGGGVNQMTTALMQYMQTGVMDRISGILLGTFTQMEDENLSPSIENLVLQLVPDHIPVAKTRLIGHRTDARAIVLGEETQICRL